MLCPKCKTKLSKVHVTIEGAKSKVTSYQCSSCEYFEFDSKTKKRVLKEIKDQLV